VFAVDVDARRVRDLRDRVTTEALKNVEVVEGAYDDPRLPEATLDAALIVNAYHEMTEYQSMLARLRKALKPEGRLVILEPISASRRAAARTEQTRRHEIAPELVQREAREAGFAVVGLEDPFANFENTYWMLVLSPTAPAAGAPAPEHVHDEDGEAATAARLTLDEFRKLQTARQVIVLDVRDESMFARGHIPGARLAPLSALKEIVAELKAAAAPIVTYCSCPAEETSGRAVAYLRKQGVETAKALIGGFDAWEKAGHPVATGK
jgi:rhodanese-related sulfurtransferase